MQVKIDSLKEKKSPHLPVTSKPVDHLHVSDMHAGSDVYRVDMETSHRTNYPMKII